MPDTMTPDGLRGHAGIADDEIVWVVHLFGMRGQLQWFLPHLRRHYPSSRVVLISDGDKDRYDDLATEYRCNLVRGQHLMRLSTGHLFLQRLFGELLAGVERYCFKIDPDAKVWRRFSRLPTASSVFGTLETVSEGRGVEIRPPANVQGGCIGITRDAVQQMLSSGLLTQEDFHYRSFQTWARCEDMERAVEAGRFCEDFAISWLAGTLGIPIVECDEIKSHWRKTPANGEGKYAITHPHKII